MPVLEDDPYGLVRYEGEPPPSLLELEGGDLVTYASSYSKTVAPGLRVGWFVAPAGLAARIEARAVSTYISPPFLAQATVHELIDRGAFEPNLERIRGLLGPPRRDAGRARARARRRATWSEPEGGYFVWLDLPADAAELLARAEAAGVTFVKGADFYPAGGGRLESARLAFSFASPVARSTRASRRSPPARGLTPAVELGEQHAADEPGDEREQDHPDQRRRRLPKTKSTEASSSLPTTNAIRYAPIRIRSPSRSQTRGCQPRSTVARRLHGETLLGLRRGERRARRREAARAAAGEAARAQPSRAGTSGTACRPEGRRGPRSGNSSHYSVLQAAWP